MGSFSHNCKLSGLPITSGPATLIVMKPSGNMYDNSDEALRKYGKTYLCSNDAQRMKYIPVWLPIHGEYNTYGTIEDIVEDDNTKLLEKYYGLSIEQIVGIITSNRKDDGYDEDLKVIKKKGKDEYGKPKYEDKYKELLTYSGMWVKTALYRKLTENHKPDVYSQMDLGTPELLEALGFEETGKSKDKRYERVFTKDNININSDGRWINIPNKHVYSLNQLKKYIEDNITQALLEVHGEQMVHGIRGQGSLHIPDGRPTNNRHTNRHNPRRNIETLWADQVQTPATLRQGHHGEREDSQGDRGTTDEARSRHDGCRRDQVEVRLGAHRGTAGEGRKTTGFVLFFMRISGGADSGGMRTR